MKVRLNDNRTDVASIKAGECFKYVDLVYMRIYGLPGSGEKIPTILLSTGAYHEFSPDTQVEAIDCVVVKVSELSVEVKDKWSV